MIVCVAALLAAPVLLPAASPVALAQQTDAPSPRVPQAMPAPGSVAPGPLSRPEAPLADPAEERRAREISKELRCLVCQNQSIEDSNAELARDLRQIVREQVAEGRSRDQILAFMVERYGDWVLMRPPVKPTTYLLWAAPALVLLAGAVIVIAFIRRQRRAYAAKAAEDGFARPLDDDEAWRLARLMDDGTPVPADLPAAGDASARDVDVVDAPLTDAPVDAAPVDDVPAVDEEPVADKPAAADEPAGRDDTPEDREPR
ncbi:cytochrome c-type biogenesis protein CcmH [Tistrella bauzanensis]|uniref:cytochrome c-type biogenesis protein n=1 Tax=Tistrella bauzanensis TaxID=657419 RepID=UPI001E4E6E4A|nr:cytochrome c-type biogenesis protein CcmH [Tistrella bauzanensis]